MVHGECKSTKGTTVCAYSEEPEKGTTSLYEPISLKVKEDRSNSTKVINRNPS